MTPVLDALAVEAVDPRALAAFWVGLLAWEPASDPHGGLLLLPRDDTGLPFRFRPAREHDDRERAVGRNRIHLDLTSTTLDAQQQTVSRALTLGARHLDVGQRPDEPHVVLADPEGNAFCVIEPGNGFLADCGPLGALACDGTQEVGHFWRDALCWPSVWDQDLETAIRSPGGGPKITWGGPPLAPLTGRGRLHLDLAPPQGGDQEAEADRLVALGARRIGREAGDPGGAVVAMADPDGNLFRVLPAP